MQSERNLNETNEGGKVAKFFGFQPINPPEVTRHDFENSKNFCNALEPQEKAALLRMYYEEKWANQSQPNLFYCPRPFHGSKEKKKPKRLEATLAILGSSKSVCECLALQAGLSILHTLGYKNAEVGINSVGDKESTNEFQKKVAAFVRKNYDNFSPELRQASKKDIFAIFRDGKEDWDKFGAECPKPIDFLSEASRCHFKEVIEFLEVLNLPYEIDQRLIGDPEVGCETVFSIKEGGEELATGFRFGRMAKKIGLKKDVPAVALDISAKLKKNLRKVILKPNRPQFYLIQFGPEAKLKSFLLLEELYEAGASVVHSVAKDKLISQMGAAEASGASHILIIGQKEALENSVIIRNSANRSQEIAPIPGFAERAKELMKS